MKISGDSKTTSQDSKGFGAIKVEAITSLAKSQEWWLLGRHRFAPHEVHVSFVPVMDHGNQGQFALMADVFWEMRLDLAELSKIFQTRPIARSYYGLGHVSSGEVKNLARLAVLAKKKIRFACRESGLLIADFHPDGCVFLGAPEIELFHA